MRLLGSKYARNAFAAVAAPRTALGELIVLPRRIAGFGGRFAAGRKTKEEETKGKEKAEEGRERQEKKEKGKGREGKRGNGRGGKGPLRLCIPGSFYYPSPPLL